jgi:hypothetical protein
VTGSFGGLDSTGASDALEESLFTNWSQWREDIPEQEERERERERRRRRRRRRESRRMKG